uniref:AlNc14C111G6398 protein n=1 Tax=Albugo laibachii Nc14 TaxID=890382 RepID=F0WIJ8_9STRA|nr:AlNc14C111G6398 [Albugo laibachii Nc14]|eukprot:CCA21080.1 AlNc14C111G6398 [Albugo laibachii Nc14]
MHTDFGTKVTLLWHTDSGFGKFLGYVCIIYEKMKISLLLCFVEQDSQRKVYVLHAALMYLNNIMNKHISSLWKFQYGTFFENQSIEAMNRFCNSQQ